ncbi:MAG: ethanolamine ammonia-lyase subunit EutC [Bryobacteraceae bacterium]|nr:ethanolamine ammonia-lyase subunit EutC [Bryobacteraceae bacterium]
MDAIERQTSWQKLRRFTTANVALQTTGSSLTTRTVLNHELAQAHARDAVLLNMDPAQLAESMTRLGRGVVQTHSAAADRAEYLMRPDLGRKLDPLSREELGQLRSIPSPDIVFVVADGLSSVAVLNHALPVLDVVLANSNHLCIGPVVIASNARVALGDEIGQLLGAQSVAVLIGERPGSSSPDSMGIYYTYGPRIGTTDAQRNCISNIRPSGLSYDAAGRELLALIGKARMAGSSGVQLLTRNRPDELR